MAQTKLYKLYNSLRTGQLCSVMKDEGNGIFISIPIDEENTDYQLYLEWAKTNTPEAAD